MVMFKAFPLKRVASDSKVNASCLFLLLSEHLTNSLDVLIEMYQPMISIRMPGITPACEKAYGRVTVPAERMVPIIEIVETFRD